MANSSCFTKYLDKIKTRKDGRQYYVYIDRNTQITAVSQDSLIDKLYEREYGRLRSAMADLYPEWLIWKRDNTSIANVTLKEHASLWNQFMKDDDIINVPMADLKARDFMNLFRRWTKSRQLTRKRFNNIKSLINGIFEYAISECEILERNVVKDINCQQFTFKPVNNNDDVFSIKERQMMLDHISDIEDVYSLAIQLTFMS